MDIYDSPQANLPRFNYPSRAVTQQNLQDVKNDLNNGSNYRILGGELQVLNTDQNAYTPVNTVGANGAQALELQDAEA